jgi:hypothetical protein
VRLLRSRERPDEASVRVLFRVYDVKLWRSEEGIATVKRLWSLGDRVKVIADVDGVGPVMAQFPRRSSLLRGVAEGTRVDMEVTLGRLYGADGASQVVRSDPRSPMTGSMAPPGL